MAAIAGMFGWTRPITLATSPRAARSPISRLSGSPGRWRPGKTDCGLRAGPLHPRAHLRRAQAAITRPSPADDRGRHARWTRSKPSCARATWEPSWSRWAPPRIGAVDPLDQILELQRKVWLPDPCRRRIRRLFQLIPDSLDEPARRAFAAIDQADSIVIDPHKHGLQPYGCGCVLFRDPGVGRFYKHDSPYTYFTSNELHLGEISLECSRAGAAAVALWATQRLLPPVPGGEFARGLAQRAGRGAGTRPPAPRGRPFRAPRRRRSRTGHCGLEAGRRPRRTRHRNAPRKSLTRAPRGIYIWR